MEKKLVNRLKRNDFEGTCEVHLVDGKYYSVEYKGKSEYYTSNKEMANTIAGVILYFYRNLEHGSKFFAKEGSEEEQWASLLAFIREESKDNEQARSVLMGVYNSLSAYYTDSKENKNDPSLGMKTTIRSKDEMMRAIHRVAALKDPSEALNNFLKYQKVRNAFVSSKKVDLELL